jgi:hypothetical protein
MIKILKRVFEITNFLAVMLFILLKEVLDLIYNSIDFVLNLIAVSICALFRYRNCNNKDCVSCIKKLKERDYGL